MNNDLSNSQNSSQMKINNKPAIVHYDVTPLDQLQLSEMSDTSNRAINQDFDVQFYPQPMDSANLHYEAQVISVFVSSRVTAQHIQAMPNLKLIICRSTGHNNIDLTAAQQRGIIVSNTPAYGTKTVAEYTLALLLQLTRRLHLSAKPGDGVGPESLMGQDIAGKTIGVIGTGAIGRHFIKLVSSFDAQIIAHDIYPNEQAAERYGYKYVNLADLFYQSDIISLHAPATPQTHHLISAQTLQQMKSGSYLINTARGELVNTSDLIQSLKTNHLAGAALDVIEQEELIWQNLTTHPNYQSVLAHYQDLQQLPHATLTPHNAYNTKEAVVRINQEVLAILGDYLQGKERNKVN